MAGKIIRSKDDKPWIDRLAKDIIANKKEMVLDKLEKFLENPLVTDSTMYAALDNSKPHYMVWDRNSLEKALMSFFSDYTIKRLAEESYYNDFGDKFKESFIYDEALGVVLKKGKLVPSYELEVEFCALPFWEGVRVLGMPFKITNIRLVDVDEVA